MILFKEVGSTGFLLGKFSVTCNRVFSADKDGEAAFFVDEEKKVVEWQIQCLFAICHADS